MFELDVYLHDRLIGRTTFNTKKVRIGRGTDNELQIDGRLLEHAFERQGDVALVVVDRKQYGHQGHGR